MAKKPFAIMTQDGDIVAGSIFDRYALKAGDGSGGGSKQLPMDAFGSHYGELDLLEPLYNLEALSRLMEINSYHSRCVKTKAQDVAGLGWELVPADEQDEKEPSEEQFHTAMAFFNEQWPPLEKILRKAQTDYESTGNAYYELVRAGDVAEAVYELMVHVPAHTVRIHRSGNKYCQVRGTQKVWFKRVGYKKDVHKETGEEHDLGSLPNEQRASEIMHLAEDSSRSDFYGVPDHVPALGAIHGHVSQRDYNIKFFDNFGIPAYAIYITGDYDLGEEDPKTGEYPVIARIKEHLRQLQKEPHSGMVFAIPSGEENGTVKVEFKALAVDVKEASFRLYRKDNRDEIISAHGVPPYRLGIVETGSLGGSTARESTEIYKTSILNPRKVMLEAYINKYILRENLQVTDWEFSLEELDTADEKHDKEILGFLFEKGGASPNDIVRNLGRRFGIEPENEEPALEARYINGQPVTYVEEIAEQTPPEAEAALLSLQRKLLAIAQKSGTREVLPLGIENNNGQ